VGRAAGQMTGFPYSNEFKKGMSDKTWSPELLDAWLEDPQNLAPGTYMMYKQGDAAIRKSIIDYLQTAK
jgi:cytochrome c